MECKSCMQTSAPRTPRRCSITIAYIKNWKQQGFVQSPRSMPGRRRRRGEEEVDCVWKPVAKKQHIQSFSMGPIQHNSSIVS